jgi:hypothetical protein
MKILEQKIKELFGVSKVIFDAFTIGKEQEAIFCDIDGITTKISSGKKSLLITGTLCICAIRERVPLGFFNEKMSLAKNESEFKVLSSETPIQFQNNNDFFIKNEVGFVYKTVRDFNPPFKVMDTEQINISVQTE